MKMMNGFDLEASNALWWLLNLLMQEGGRRTRMDTFWWFQTIKFKSIMFHNIYISNYRWLKKVPKTWKTAEDSISSRSRRVLLPWDFVHTAWDRDQRSALHNVQSFHKKGIFVAEWMKHHTSNPQLVHISIFVFQY